VLSLKKLARCDLLGQVLTGPPLLREDFVKR
jgi:hypothetical protein